MADKINVLVVRKTFAIHEMYKEFPLKVLIRDTLRPAILCVVGRMSSLSKVLGTLGV